MDYKALWRNLADSLVPTFESYRADLGSLSVSQKPDKTLLSVADLAVERLIVSTIQLFDPTAVIVAEEGTSALPPSRRGDGRIWIIDPIDGTSEFVKQGRREFCSVVCALEDRRPVAAFVLAPELGPQRTPLCVTFTDAHGSVSVNDEVACVPESSSGHASVTQSAGLPAYPFEPTLLRAGYEIKRRTTSQTLDMVRTCLNINPHTDLDLPSFDLFYRRRQKVWDGAAGMCLALTTGRAVIDEGGHARKLIDIDLSTSEPEFPVMLVGRADLVSAVVDPEGWKAMG